MQVDRTGTRCSPRSRSRGRARWPSSSAATPPSAGSSSWSATSLDSRSRRRFSSSCDCCRRDRVPCNQRHKSQVWLVTVEPITYVVQTPPIPRVLPMTQFLPAFDLRTSFTLVSDESQNDQSPLCNSGKLCCPKKSILSSAWLVIFQDFQQVLACCKFFCL